jgi:hypothetical protein
VISSFFAAMVVLAGAEWSARGGVRAENLPEHFLIEE